MIPSASGTVSNTPGYNIVNQFGDVTIANGRDEQRFKSMLEEVMAKSIRNLSLGIR